MILHRAGDDLRSRCGTLVDENHQWTIEPVRVSGGFEHGVVLGGPTSGGGDELALFEEEIRDAHSCVEGSAGVVAQVEDEPGHALGGEIRDDVLHLARAGVGELGEPDVTDVGLDQEGVPHRCLRDPGAFDLDVERLLEPRTRDRQNHDRPLRSANQVHHLVEGEPLCAFPGHAGDDVARPQPPGGRGSARDRGDDCDLPVPTRNDDPDAEERSFLSGPHMAERSRVEIARVGVEHLEHAADPVIDDVGRIVFLRQPLEQAGDDLRRTEHQLLFVFGDRPFAEDGAGGRTDDEGRGHENQQVWTSCVLGHNPSTFATADGCVFRSHDT